MSAARSAAGVPLGAFPARPHARPFSRPFVALRERLRGRGAHPLPSVVILNEPMWRRGGRGRIRLTTAMHALVGTQGWTVPEGFDSDGASVPWWAWWLVGHPYSPSSLRAAVLHDWLFRVRGQNPTLHLVTPDTKPLSAWEVHRIFRAALLADGVAPVRAWAMWCACAIRYPRWPTLHR